MENKEYFLKDVAQEVEDLKDEFGVEDEFELSEDDIMNLAEKGYASWQIANIICGIEE